MENISTSGSKIEIKKSWILALFILSIAYSAYATFSRVIDAVNLTLGDKFFYFLTTMWYLYFPSIFTKYFGNSEKSDKAKKFLTFWAVGKSAYPIAFNVAFIRFGLNEITYFIAVVIFIIVINIVGFVFIFIFFDKRKDIKDKVASSIIIILFSVFGIVGQLFFPFTRVSPWRIILFGGFWTVLIGIFIYQLLSKLMRGKIKKMTKSIRT